MNTNYPLHNIVSIDYTIGYSYIFVTRVNVKCSYHNKHKILKTLKIKQRLLSQARGNGETHHCTLNKLQYTPMTVYNTDFQKENKIQ